jgi:hypothetical protein
LLYLDEIEDVQVLASAASFFRPIVPAAMLYVLKRRVGRFECSLQEDRIPVAPPLFSENNQVTTRSADRLNVFTTENLWQYAVLSAMGAEPRVLLVMIFAQAGLCAVLGTGMGIGLCAIVGQVSAIAANYPFRMMCFAPLVGGTAVVLVSIAAAVLSARPVLKLQPMVVFERR